MLSGDLLLHSSATSSMLRHRRPRPPCSGDHLLHAPVTSTSMPWRPLPPHGHGSGRPDLAADDQTYILDLDLFF
jgi:hypothetical protein